MKKNNTIDPLDELRIQKELAKAECAESEARLGEYWNYLTNNAGNLILNSAINNVSRKLGFGTSKSSSSKNNAQSSKGGVFQGILGGLIASAPIVWEIAQPMVIGFLIRKFKSLFSGKKK